MNETYAAVFNGHLRKSHGQDGVERELEGNKLVFFFREKIVPGQNQSGSRGRPGKCVLPRVLCRAQVIPVLEQS